MDKNNILDISDNLLDAILLTETVRDACMNTDNTAYSRVLDIVLKKQQKVHDLLEKIQPLID